MITGKRIGIREVVICIICKDWELGKLTWDEAWHNLDELWSDAIRNEEDIKHYFELAQKLADEKDPV